MLDEQTRTAVGFTAAQINDYHEAYEFHLDAVRANGIGVVAGFAPNCRALFRETLERIDRGDLLEAMGLTDDAVLHALLVAAEFDAEARSEAFGTPEDILREYV